MRGLRRALHDSHTRLTATFVLLPRVEIVISLARSGFDAVILDLEHGPFTVGDLPPLIAAGQGAGLHVLVRVPDNTAPVIGSVLDTGPDGIVVPHVSSMAGAKAAVASGRFPPQGERSANPYVRAAGYGSEDGYLDAVNDRVAILVMVEGADGVAALLDIAGVPGVDGVFVGPVDLSAALGLPGQPEHPDVVARIHRILDDVEALGVPTGVFAPTPHAAERWRGLGTRLVALSADLAMAADSFRRYAAAAGP